MNSKNVENTHLLTNFISLNKKYPYQYISNLNIIIIADQQKYKKHSYLVELQNVENTNSLTNCISLNTKNPCVYCQNK